ncbi:hypothetical protein [Holdemania massiliensis]|uniref:Uncharacterized protein n=2 Tax=Holdemania massiliensis TaxID=1468449 RepID=A0A6N7S2R3_9FIRM|nr:hypothetical protein [Holdemania massiliensis]MSA70345.1 hypothetical protein [Holdemania massiliensis]MSA88124.1 hypothetical protein [Holdemania massiliensis]MSB76953.1 hypothetical protein [Holdemania massiliensis]MSC31879.1 hypothetical protein [Holdemania massiliensis]MSC38199.1 hypothetical protein [Holdemania massiliensis]
MKRSQDNFLAHLIIETYLQVIAEKTQFETAIEVSPEIYQECFKKTVKVIWDSAETNSSIIKDRSLLSEISQKDFNYNPAKAYQFLCEACLQKQIGENKIESFIKHYNKRKQQLNITAMDSFDHVKRYHTVLDVYKFYYLKFYTLIRMPIIFLGSISELLLTLSLVGRGMPMIYNFYAVLMILYLLSWIILFWNTLFVKAKTKRSFVIKWILTILYWSVYTVITKDSHLWIIYNALDIFSIPDYLRYFKITDIQ